MLLGCSVDTPIHINRSHLLCVALRFLCGRGLRNQCENEFTTQELCYFQATQTFAHEPEHFQHQTALTNSSSSTKNNDHQGTEDVQSQSIGAHQCSTVQGNLSPASEEFKLTKNHNHNLPGLEVSRWNAVLVPDAEASETQK